MTPWLREESDDEEAAAAPTTTGEAAPARSFEMGVGELRAERPLHTVKGSSTMRSMKWNCAGKELRGKG